MAQQVKTADIRDQLVAQYELDPFRPMVEIKGASFEADKPAIIGQPNARYIAEELEWYEGMDLSIHSMKHVPVMWKRTADSEGRVNSNYGWVFWSKENGDQFGNVVLELRRDFASRRALAIYTRPSMHVDQKLSGDGQDFMCTNAVAYSIDPDRHELDVVVQMRSNDVVFGYRNDYAWQQYAAMYVVAELQQDWPSLTMGTMFWQAQSLHVYPRHYHLLRSVARGKTDEMVVDGEVR